MEVIGKKGVCLGSRDSLGHLLVITPYLIITVNGNCSNLSSKRLKQLRPLGDAGLNHYSLKVHSPAKLVETVREVLSVW